MTSQWQSCKLWESKTCDLSAPAISILLCSCSCLKTLLTQRALLTLQVHALFKLKFWIFPLITYFGYHVTEYCAVIGTHSTVRGDKLLYGHIPDPFPWCRIGSGHARLRLCIAISLTSVLQSPVFYSHQCSTVTSVLQSPVFYSHQCSTVTSVLLPVWSDWLD